MANYCVLSIKKYHTFPQVTALQRHNNREIPLANVDQSLSVHNQNLLTRGNSYCDVWHEIVKEEETKRGQKIGLRKNSVLVLEIVTGISQEKSKDINIQAWADANLNWMKKTFGEQNIIASTLHLDETSPHIHTEVVPIDERGRLNAKAFTGGRLAMMNLHTSYAKEMEPFGLVRGEKASKSKKKDLASFYKAVNQAKSASLPPRMRNEEEEDYIKRMEEYCKKMKMAVTKMELELESANALIGTRLAQEFSRYSHAVSLYEDLYQKYEGDEKKVNTRITAYRKIENRTPSDALSGLLTNLLTKFEDRETPLVNWAEKGKKGILRKEKEENQNNDVKEDENITDRHYIPLEDAELFMDDEEKWEYDEDDGSNEEYDI